MAINQRCSRCNGTGSISEYGDPPQTECPDCEGSGKIEWGTQVDIMDKLNDILNKCNDILEQVDG